MVYKHKHIAYFLVFAVLTATAVAAVQSGGEESEVVEVTSDPVVDEIVVEADSILESNSRIKQDIPPVGSLFDEEFNITSTGDYYEGYTCLEPQF